MSDDKHEIVIIHRGGHGAHDEHHGGVWKIAFADFMTAMMAFFLVMWLIAANDKTRATIARYFNPVKLVDATVRKQGLHDPKTDDATTTSNGHDTAEVKGPAKDDGNHMGGAPTTETAKGREARLDATLRSNPFAALAEIAGTKGPGEGPPRDVVPGRAPVIGHQGGPAFRDPFAPPTPQSADAEDKDDDLMTITPPRPVAPPAPPAAAAVDPAAPQPEPQADVDEKLDVSKLKKKDQDLAKQLMASLKAPNRDAGGPDVAVRRTSEGFLVSVTDTNNFSMFSNGSAVPSRRVVVMMERVAKILAAKPGKIVIRGFTDNKPFRVGRYDNWSLSVDRAQAAHYMLVRGGLSDQRIATVEGFADHGPVSGLDPASPLNRRIEILLKDDVK